MLRITGVVQGVGFRPFVHTLATALQLVGTVRNDVSGVAVEVEGPTHQLDEFERRLRDDAPALASIATLQRVNVPAQLALRELGFTVIDSDATDGPIGTIPPDVAVCDDCLRELFDPADRRYWYPFITCTNCGPRFTITRTLPYDRPNTTMADFELCAPCRAEYEDVTDRRFHAQPIACSDCGPQVELVDKDGDVTARAADAIRDTQRLLEGGSIVAVKGIGGYHLMCDAMNADAVTELRKRKRRGDKPLAVMVARTEVAASAVRLDSVGQRILESPQRPILLAPRRVDAPSWARIVAPGAAEVGVMLPYAPLHHLLFESLATEVLVCTSGNLADEPIATDPVDAFKRLTGIADAWLHHDRPIHTACDDSIVRVARQAPALVRRSRGWVPLPINLAPTSAPTSASNGHPAVLALGGDLKGSVCVTDGTRAWLSQHLGDFGELATYQAARRAIEQLLDFTRIKPDVVAIDAHPGYLSARLGREFAAERGLTIHTVQHHHAHIASVLAEAQYEGRVIGMAFDGTGYGRDGAIWGGEVLVADTVGFERVAHLAYVPLPGADAAIEHPARTALAHLWASGCPWDQRLPAVAAMDAATLAIVRQQLERGVATAPTSSMGRLFDAVAALAGVRQRVDFEAQAAIELEAVADHAAIGTYRFAAPDNAGAVDAAPIIRAVVADVLSATPVGTISMRFHRAIVSFVVDTARQIRDERDLSTVALSGGVYQNGLLTESCIAALEAEGFQVLCHRHVPPNDGGLALGQAVIAGRTQTRQY